MEENRVAHHEKLIVIGGSAGSLAVLFKLLPKLRSDLSIPILIVLHRRSSGDSSLADLLATKTDIPITEVEDKDQIMPSHLYLAPSDYHVLIEKDFTFALDYSEKVNFSRPSLDVTYESAADIYGESVVGIILSGANEDGTKGILEIKRNGGTIIAQDPQTAQMPVMPQNAISQAKIDRIYSVTEMADFINEI